MDKAGDVRRSIARVSFKWRNKQSLDRKTVGTLMEMVIPGIIISVKDGECLMITNPCFFQGRQRLNFQVNLPEPDGKYGENIEAKSLDRIDHEEFCGFIVKANDYVQPVTFETAAIDQCDRVFAFSFPREIVAFASYSAGQIVDSSQSNQNIGVVFHDCALHEYGFLGSPLLNQNGHVVGICYASQSRIHAWAPSFLRKQFDLTFTNDWSSRIVYLLCSNKDSSQEGGSSCEHRNQQGDPNQQGGSNPSASSLTHTSVHCTVLMPQQGGSNTPADASNWQPPPSSCSSMDIKLGDVPQHVEERSRTEVPGSSVPLHRVPASFPSGVVTLAYKSETSSKTLYFPGLIIMCEPGQGNAHTTYVFSTEKSDFDEVYVYFQPNRSALATVRSRDYAGFMIVSIDDVEFHEPLAWSSSVLPDYELVRTVCIMAGTKLNAEAPAPIQSLVGHLGVYGGEITTPRCSAATTSSCAIISGTENYFQFSCSFQDDFSSFKNMDLEKDIYKCDSAVLAPVFSLKGEFLGIVISSGNWPDLKTGLYSQLVLSKVEYLMNKVPGQNGWSKAQLRWSSAQSV